MGAYSLEPSFTVPRLVNFYNGESLLSSLVRCHTFVMNVGSEHWGPAPQDAKDVRMPPPVYSALQISVDEHVATLTLLDTGSQPSIGAAHFAELPQACAWIEQTDGVRAVVIRGSGGHFSFGLGARAMAGSSKAVAPASSLRTWLLITLPTTVTYSGARAWAAAGSV